MASFLNTLAAFIVFIPAAITAPADTKAVCQKIGNQISSQSAVYYAGSLEFTSDIHHWFLSSSQVPACVVEVGSEKDTSIALKIVGQTKTPFAVQSGGHASNPGFSNTKGVHISLKRFDSVTLSSDKKTATIGFGQTWTDVYQKLDGSGVNIVGGRTPGPGVGGFTLGGGFSWKTNQHGLTCDTVQSYTLVLPNGTISNVDSSQSELFFALKGGLNRFGIVISAVFNTHQQPDPIYGGFNIYSSDKTDAITNATAQFYKENTDPKTQIITTLSGSITGTSALVLFFHDGPTSPPSFDEFNKIIPITLLPNVRSQSFSSFVSGIPSQIASVVNTRGTFDTMSTSALTSTFIEAVKKEADTNGKLMLLHGGLMASYDIEPFDSTYGKFATDSAYPHDQSPLPLNLYFSWSSASQDTFWYNAMKTSIQRLIKVAQSEGIYVAPKYPNYAITGTTAQHLYGSANAGRLETVRAQVDPNKVMELAGGFNI